VKGITTMREGVAEAEVGVAVAEASRPGVSRDQ